MGVRCTGSAARRRWEKGEGFAWNAGRNGLKSSSLETFVALDHASSFNSVVVRSNQYVIPISLVHRRRGGEMLLRLLALAGAPVELPEAEVAVGDEGAHLWSQASLIFP